MSTPTIRTETRTIDGIEIELISATCVHCRQAIGRSNGRGQRAWRHIATFSGLCAGGESCADPA